MAEKKLFYKCRFCGNLVEVIEGGDGTLFCCGEPMKLFEAKTQASEGKEKHVPVIEVNGQTVTIKVGSIPHPMEENHYIELIQLIVNGDTVLSKSLNPGEKPEAVFYNIEDTNSLSAKALCNIHGLWTS